MHDLALFQVIRMQFNHRWPKAHLRKLHNLRDGRINYGPLKLPVELQAAVVRVLGLHVGNIDFWPRR